jgi:hypothetical protein
MREPLVVQLPPGIYKSGTPASVQGRWADGNLVRWHSGALQPLGGWERSTSTPHSTVCRRFLPFVDADGLRRLMMACEEGLFVETSGTIVDVSPVGFTPVDPVLSVGGYGTNVYSYDDYGDGRPDTLDPFAAPYGYFLDTWGSEVLAVQTSDGRLMHWVPSSPEVAATIPATSPTACQSMVVTPERHVMIGGYSGNPRTVRWSSRESLIDWDLASTTNTAGELVLETPGEILSMVKVREGTLVFTDVDVWLIRYTGQPFVYGQEKLAEHCGPLSPQSIATFNGRAMWLGPDNFWIYEAGQVNVMPSELGDFVFDDMARTTGRFTACASLNGIYPEVWFSYPTLDADDNDITVIFHTTERWWSIARFGRTAMHPGGLLPWMTTAGYDKHNYLHEKGWLAAGVSRVGDVWAETYAVSLGAGGRVMTVLGGEADSFTGYEKTRFRFFARLSREGSVYDGATFEREFGPYSATVYGRIDCRFAARDLRLRVEANADALWTTGALRLSLSPRGGR